MCEGGDASGKGPDWGQMSLPMHPLQGWRRTHRGSAVASGEGVVGPKAALPPTTAVYPTPTPCDSQQLLGIWPVAGRW